MTQIDTVNFTTEQFCNFLLERIFDTILYCEPHQVGMREYLTAIGQLMDDYYLVQIQSDHKTFEDVQVIHLSPGLTDNLLRISLIIFNTYNGSNCSQNIEDKAEFNES